MTWRLVKARRPVVEKLPVDFNLYSLPSFPQDNRLLVWILQTMERWKNSVSLSLVITFNICPFMTPVYSTERVEQCTVKMATTWATFYTNENTRNDIKGISVYEKVTKMFLREEKKSNIRTMRQKKKPKNKSKTPQNNNVFMALTEKIMLWHIKTKMGSQHCVRSVILSRRDSSADLYTFCLPCEGSSAPHI